jgi:hypothetical protein
MSLFIENTDIIVFLFIMGLWSFIIYMVGYERASNTNKKQLVKAWKNHKTVIVDELDDLAGL